MTAIHKNSSFQMRYRSGPGEHPKRTAGTFKYWTQHTHIPLISLISSNFFVLLLLNPDSQGRPRGPRFGDLRLSESQNVFADG